MVLKILQNPSFQSQRSFTAWITEHPSVGFSPHTAFPLMKDDITGQIKQSVNTVCVKSEDLLNMSEAFLLLSEKGSSENCREICSSFAFLHTCVSVCVCC